MSSTPGPDKGSFVNNFFLKDIERDVWVCQVVIKQDSEGQAGTKKCLAEFHATTNVQKGTRAFNLKRHVKRLHPLQWTQMEEKQAKAEANKVRPNLAGPSILQTNLKAFFKSDKITITMTKDILVDSIVRMVVKNGLPLRFFSGDAYKRGHGETALKVGVSLDRDAVKEYVINAAEKLKIDLKNELKGKFLFLKLDCATRIQTNYLGVNVRYIDSENKAVTKTLMLVDTKSEHTSKELKAKLVNILQEFDIPMNKVICCVSDNASNMVKLVMDLNTEQTAAQSQPEYDESDEEDNLSVSSGNVNCSEYFNSSNCLYFLAAF